MLKAVLDVHIPAVAALNERGLAALEVDLAIAMVHEMILSDHIQGNTQIVTAGEFLDHLVRLI